MAKIKSIIQSFKCRAWLPQSFTDGMQLEVKKEKKLGIQTMKQKISFRNLNFSQTVYFDRLSLHFENFDRLSLHFEILC